MPIMDRDLLDAVCKQIYRRFPEVTGSKPRVRAYEGDQSLLIFQAKGISANGRPIPHTIRVVVDPKGKIKKVTSSR